MRPSVPLLAMAIAATAHAQATDSAKRAAECPPCAEWNIPHAPLRIFGNAYYVGTKNLGSILITSSTGHALLDGALPESAPLILANIRALGFDPNDVKVILNSHAHYDHAGGIAELARTTGAEVVALESSARAMERGGPVEDDPQLHLGLPFPSVRAVRRIGDGATVRAGSITLTAHRTAGHTSGATTWTWRSCEGDRCLDLVYADSQTPISDDDFRFTASRAYPTAIADFEHGHAVLEHLACDILVTPHPGASSFWQRVAARDAGAAQALVNPNACKAYAATARRALADRIGRERGRP